MAGTLGLCAGILIGGCQNSRSAQDSSQIPSSEEAGSSVRAPLTSLSSSRKDTLPLTNVEFDQYVVDFGTLTSGEEFTYTFHFRNTGEAPLVIQEVRTSCGCTVPVWPRKPILPGETGELTVVYNSTGHQGHIVRKVLVYANVPNSPIVLQLRGNVSAR